MKAEFMYIHVVVQMDFLLFNLNESNKFETGLTDDIGNPQQIL